MRKGLKPFALGEFIATLATQVRTPCRCFRESLLRDLSTLRSLCAMIVTALESSIYTAVLTLTNALDCHRGHGTVKVWRMLRSRKFQSKRTLIKHILILTYDEKTHHVSDLFYSPFRETKRRRIEDLTEKLVTNAKSRSLAAGLRCTLCSVCRVRRCEHWP